MTTASPATSTGIKLTTEIRVESLTGRTSQAANANTTSYTVRNLMNVTNYTLEVHALRGLEEGPASGTSANTPDGPATVPERTQPPGHPPRRPRLHRVVENVRADEDARAPVTSYRVRYRQIGTTSWQNTSVTSDRLLLRPPPQA